MPWAVRGMRHKMVKPETQASRVLPKRLHTTLMILLFRYSCDSATRSDKGFSTVHTEYAIRRTIYSR